MGINGELKLNLGFDGLTEPQLMPNLTAMFINYNVIRNGSIDAVPVHGYSGWALDAIRILEAKSNLTGNDMYGLARAYDHISIQKRAKQLAPDKKITSLNERMDALPKSSKLEQYLESKR